MEVNAAGRSAGVTMTRWSLSAKEKETLKKSANRLAWPMDDVTVSATWKSMLHVAGDAINIIVHATRTI